MISYFDVSSYEGHMTIPSGMPAVVAKATEGTYYQDSSYTWFKSEAARVGAAFSGYHFLKADEDPAAQAAYYHSFAGNVPCMLDVETEGSSLPTVDQCLTFIHALEGLGGRVWGAYIPRWYWSQVGGDLSLLTASGAVLISSNYTSYSDTGPGWQPYGGATPTIWQYTSTPVDTNAFKGTAAELATIINGDTVDLNTQVPFSPAVVQFFPELANQGFTGSASLGTVLGWMAARVAHLVNEVDQLKSQIGGSVSPQAVASETLAELKAKL